jgi:hypothetical protein
MNSQTAAGGRRNEHDGYITAHCRIAIRLPWRSHPIGGVMTKSTLTRRALIASTAAVPAADIQLEKARKAMQAADATTDKLHKTRTDAAAAVLAGPHYGPWL